MIQPIDDGDGYSLYGRVMSCRVHDMVLDLISSLSSDENFVTVLDGNGQSITNSQSKVRKLSLQDTPSKLDQSTAPNSVSQVRSITVFAPATNLMPPLSRFDVLRVLELSGCDIKKSSHLNLKDVGNLLHLRYLGLRYTGIRELPAEIGNLQFLLVLDVRDNYFLKELPLTIVKLRRLMCLLSYPLHRLQDGVMVNLDDDKCQGLPDGMGKLTSMEELGWLSTRKSPNIVKELRNLTRLRELKIKLHGGSLELEEAFVEFVCNLCSIQSLYLRGSFESLDLLGECWVPPRHLRAFESCYVGKFSTLPTCVKRNPLLLSDLSVLTIEVKELHQGDLEILGRLPALCSIVIWITNQMQRLLSIGDGGFRCVTNFTLILKSCGLIMFQRGALPRAEQVCFNFGVRMVKDERSGDFDFGLGNLLSLRNVNVLIYHDGATVGEAKQAKAALRHTMDVHPNHPTIEIGFEPELQESEEQKVDDHQAVIDEGSD